MTRLNLNINQASSFRGMRGQSQQAPTQMLMMMRALLRMMSQLMSGMGNSQGCQQGVSFGQGSPAFGGCGGHQGGGHSGHGGSPAHGMTNFLGAPQSGGHHHNGHGAHSGHNHGGHGTTAPSFGTPGQSNYSGNQAQARGTGYYPDSSRMEGGYVDRKGKKLNTLQDFLEGRAPYVSVAMDHTAGIPYGQPVRIAELERKYGRQIPFRVVDTGGAFKGRGTGRIDVCTRSKQHSLDPTINGPLTLKFV